MKNRWAWLGGALLFAGAMALPLVTNGQKNKLQWPEEISLRELERIQQKLEQEMAQVQKMLEQKLGGIEKRIPSDLDHKLAALEELKLEGLQEKLETLNQDSFQQLVREAEAQAQELAKAGALLSQNEFREQLLEAEVQAQKLARAGALLDGQTRAFFTSDGETGWLGVSVNEITAEKAKELKLPAERGVMVDEIDENSPAAKAGLKKGDVITEFGGQRVEGVTQFRRYVRETPAGRAVQVTVWRDGRAQQISVTIGDWNDHWRGETKIFRDSLTQFIPRYKGNFAFSVPDTQVYTFTSRPTLGIRTEDLDGQLGAYFGAPDSEGVLVTHVNPGSPAEKAGLKAGDVIIKVDGGRVRDTNDLRERMRDAREKKTVPIAVIRKGAETSVNVEIEQPKPPERTKITRRINL